jgi:tetratricopeptide (TPR) repeat protein
VRLLVGALCLPVLVGCSQLPSRDYGRFDLQPVVELTATPFFPQDDFQCGPAALATVINASGVQVSPESIQPLVFMPARAGSLQAEMLAAPANYGLLGVRIRPELPALLETLEAGQPVVVLQNLGLQAWPVWHYAVVVGYDLDLEQVVLRSGRRQRVTLSFAVFEKTWSRAGYWAMVVTEPVRVPEAVALEDFLAAASVLERLQRLPQARLAYVAASRRWPDAALVWAGAGNVAYAQADFAAAGQAYRQALSRDAGNVLLLNNLALTLAEQGCPEQAQAAIRCALEHAPGTQVLIQTAEEISRFSRPAGICQTFSCKAAGH